MAISSALAAAIAASAASLGGYPAGERDEHNEADQVWVSVIAVIMAGVVPEEELVPRDAELFPHRPVEELTSFRFGEDLIARAGVGHGDVTSLFGEPGELISHPPVVLVAKLTLI